jgi:hypothetical protein
MTSRLTEVQVVGAEKRRKDSEKYYAYCLRAGYSNAKTHTVWRRYSEFDGLQQTLQALSKPKARSTSLDAFRKPLI